MLTYKTGSSTTTQCQCITFIWIEMQKKGYNNLSDLTDRSNIKQTIINVMQWQLCHFDKAIIIQILCYQCILCMVTKSEELGSSQFFEQRHPTNNFNLLIY